jgi:hypothetical protein
MRVNRGVVLVAGLFLAASLILAGYYHLRAGDSKSGASSNEIRVQARPEPKGPLPTAPSPADAPSRAPADPVAPAPPAPVVQVPVAPPPGSVPILPPGPLGPIPPPRLGDHPPTTTAPPKDSLWTITVHMKDGKTMLIARARSKDVEFRVQCDAVDLQSPNGSIQARGNVKITAPQLEAASQGLTIQLHDDRLVLDGQAQVTQRGDGQELELRGERLTLRLLIRPEKATAR